MEERRMARPIYSHEVLDADFQWLLQHYCENHPAAFMVDSTCMPIVLILGEGKDKVAAKAHELAPSPEEESAIEDPLRKDE
jgi:hypothetical protein